MEKQAGRLRVRIMKWQLMLMILLVGVLTALPAAAFTLQVVDQNGAPITSGFRWLLEEDTSHLTIPGAAVSDSITNNIHNSYAPVVSKGNSATASTTVTVPNTTRYFVSVLPYNFAYEQSGTVVPALGDFDYKSDVITVTVNSEPIPTSQISLLAFVDHAPINNAPDAVEVGLGGAKVTLSDLGGPLSQDAYDNPLGTTYQLCGDTGEMLDATGSPCVLTMGSGVIITMTEADVNNPAKNPYGLKVGEALIKYLTPGKYGVIVTPPQTDSAGNPVAWIQTATIEGTPTIDAWVQANEPRLFVEGFGTGFNHVSFGFVNPAALPWAISPPTGTGSLTGVNRYNHFSAPPANQGFYAGEPVPECWIGINDPVTATGLYAAPCNADSSFTVNNVPAGTYELVTWDKPLDALFGFNTVIVPGTVSPTGDPVNLGDVLSFRWFGTFEGKVFYDIDQDGFPDANEPGIANQNVNLRFRNGTVYQAQATDINGEYMFSEVFPFFKWLVTEVDFARYKATGMTAVVDAGGIVTPDQGWSWPSRDKLHPQTQAETNVNTGNALARTETGPVLTQAMHLFLNQTNEIDWGKANYGPGENGGISGIVFYAVTRAEDDPRYAAAETWEPGIPRVQVNLYKDVDRNGVIDDVNTSTAIELADVDNSPLGWNDGSGLKGPEDIDRNGNGTFDQGDAVGVTWTDSWDDNKPTGCIQPNKPIIHGNPIPECADAYGTWNQVRPGLFDGGYSFGTNLPIGTYIVEAVPPNGYVLVKEEDKNVDFGDSYTPSTQLLPPVCVGDAHLVPPYLSLQTDAGGALLPGIGVADAIAPFYSGLTRPLCDRKQVNLSGSQNAAADFHFFTETPKAARVLGFTNNDLSAEFNAGSPVFGEKHSPAWLPVAVRDWAGNELLRVYTDEFGTYNALLPSTATMNVPAPSGVSPKMLTVVLNDPFLPDGSRDANYDPNYSVTPWTLQYTPGQVTYLDTPLVPVAAFAGYPRGGVDANPASGVPVITAINGPGQAGPVVCTELPGRTITMSSRGTVQVPNPNYNPAGPDTNTTVTRDFGFGATTGSVTINGVALTIDSWTDATITATLPAGVTTSGTVLVTRGDNAMTSPIGVTLNLVTCTATNVRHVPAQYATIQAAIDAASPGDIVLVAAGVYDEMIFLYKPLILQGSGAGGTNIVGNPNPPSKLAAWHDKARTLLGTDPFQANEGPGIMVLGNVPPANGGAPFDGTIPARIDGFTVLGSLAGGGIDVDNSVNKLVISNNEVTNNQGNYGGGIVVGAPGVDSANSGIVIRDNTILKNGGIQGPGGIAIYPGTSNYVIENNLIKGNFSRASGGGIGHVGLSDNGVIRNNRILFNEVFNGINLAGVGDGGGIYVGNDPLLTGGSGNVQINANLIQGNLAGMGYGGGIRANSIDSPAGAPINTLTLTNNMIVNNVAGINAGGVSLQSATSVRLIHNTIAHNDSTATGRNAFAPGALDSVGQAAGLVANAANPVLVNNIIFENRSFGYDHTLNAMQGGLVANGYWDLDGTVNPDYSLLTSLTGRSGENFADGSNIAATGSPFVLTYFNDLVTAAVIDEGGNAINVKFTILNEAAGNYHLNVATQPINAATATAFNPTLLASDIDQQPRPSGAAADIGADEAQLAVTVVTPNGGEFLTSGKTYKAQWGVPAGTTRSRLHYSTNGGSTWTFIADVMTGTEFNWKIPTVTVDTPALLRVRAFNAGNVLLGEDVSNAPFTMTVTTRLLAPNGGEILLTGTTQTIKWVAPLAGRRAGLTYSLNNGASWRTIATVTGAESYEWTVPAITGTTAKCLVRVRIFNSAGTEIGLDISDAPCAIVAQAPSFTGLAVTYPDGGQSLKSGTSYVVTWTPDAGAAAYALAYTTNNGANWTPIATVGPVTGYIWTAPAVAGAMPQSRVRITALDAAGGTLATDESNANFTIQP